MGAGPGEASVRKDVSQTPRLLIPAPVRQLPMSEIARSPNGAGGVGIDNSFPEKFVDGLSRREVFNKRLLGNFHIQPRQRLP